MDGVRLSAVYGVWNGGGVYCCRPAQCSGVVLALLIPVQYSSVLLLCRVLFSAGCVVCGRCVCLCCSCGGVSFVYAPLTVMVGGGIVDGGVA